MVFDKKVYKILVVGSFGSGKTTFVKTLSEIEPLLTEKRISNPVGGAKNKETTTVAMDMGKFRLKDGTEVHLFATPGQERFDFMLDVLKKGVAGAVVLVDATDDNSLHHAERFIKRLRENSNIPIVVAITKTDIVSPRRVEEIKRELKGLAVENLTAEIVDPRKKEMATQLVERLISLTDF